MLPHYLPVVGYGLSAEAPPAAAPPPPKKPPRLDLSVLLSQVLLAFTLEFERESKVSLAIAQNALRVLDEDGVRVRDLPRLTGISKEAVSMSVGFLEKRGDVLIEPDPDSARGKVVKLTAPGRRSQESSRRLVAADRGSAGRHGSGPRRWPTCERRSSRSPALPGRSPTPTAGARHCRRARRCRTIRPCCIAAGFPTAVEPS